MTIFNFYIVLSSLTATSYFASFKSDSNLEPARPALAALLCVFAFIFWKLDQRNKFLIKNAEHALKHFESADQGDDVTKVFMHEEVETNAKQVKGWDHLLFWRTHLSYSDCFNLVFIIFFAIGLVGTVSSGVQWLRLLDVGFHSRAYHIVSSKQESDEIAFDIENGKQQIEASCVRSNNDCQDFSLKTGQWVDCYFNPNQHEGDVYSYDKKVPRYEASGLVCHVGQGRGRLFVVHTRTCVDVRQIDEPNAVLHKTEDPAMTPFIGKTYTSVTVKCTTVSDCANDFKYGDFLALAIPEENLAKELERAQEPNSGFEVVWHPSKRWVRKEMSDQERLRQFQEHLESYKKDTPKIPQIFDPNGIRLPDELKGYYREGDANRFCKDIPDRYFDDHGKEVLRDDTIEVEVHSIK